MTKWNNSDGTTSVNIRNLSWGQDSEDLFKGIDVVLDRTTSNHTSETLSQDSKKSTGVSRKIDEILTS